MDPQSGCALCEGRCPDCGGDVGAAAGSLNWVLCSLCHATFRHDHAAERNDGEAHEGD